MTLSRPRWGRGGHYLKYMTNSKSKLNNSKKLKTNNSKIKVLVATKKTQGSRSSDFCKVKEGELVTYTFECDRDKNNIDGTCGCHRSMSSVLTGKGTTTVKVAEKKITKAKFVDLLKKIMSVMDGTKWVLISMNRQELMQLNFFPFPIIFLSVQF